MDGPRQQLHHDPEHSVHVNVQPSQRQVAQDNPMYPKRPVGSDSYHQLIQRSWGMRVFLSVVGVFLFLGSYAYTSAQLRTIADSTAVISPSVISRPAVDVRVLPPEDDTTTDLVASQPLPETVLSAGTVFEENFSGDLYIEETARASDSSNADWWLNSGAFVFRRGDVGYSVEGDLPDGSPWIASYQGSNALATDAGRKPQNVLRLIKRGQWLDTSQEMYFTVLAHNETDSEERGESNGLLLFSRYIDDDHLYYAGIRADGHTVIKKKVAGTYYTLHKEPFLDGTYNEVTRDSLIPTDTEIGVKVITENLDNGSVRIQLFMDMGRTYNWQKVAEVVDGGIAFGGAPHDVPSNTGLRTDFVDVSFDHYKLRAL